MMALLLAVVGIYGLLSYHVAQSTREIGIRMALGADRARVFRLVLVQGAILGGIGIVLGIAGAWAASRFLESFLFNVRPFDAPTYAGISVLMACVAMAASYVPARRATSVDPIIALRQE
jgi:ABC-type antimicrobial peptide transport system permease subunit